MRVLRDSKEVKMSSIDLFLGLGYIDGARLEMEHHNS